MAQVKSNLVTNIAVWDGVSLWAPPDTDKCEILNPNTKFGDPIHARQGAYTYNIVIDGNSIALVDYGPTTRACEAAVIAAGLTQYDFINMARNGYQTTQLITDAPLRVDKLYESALIGKNIVIIWEGSNDIAAGKTDTQAYANIKQYGTDRKAAGWKVIVATILPRTQASSANANQETYRLSVNSMIRTAKTNGETWIDAVADVASDATMGALASAANASYYTGGLHPTELGNQLLVSYFTNAINLIR